MAKPDPRINWKTFAAPVEKFKVEYPVDWKIIKAQYDGGDANQESYTLQAPNGFELGYDVYKTSESSVGDCVRCEVHELTALPSANYGKTLYSFIVTNVLDGGQQTSELTVSDKQSLAEQRYKMWGNYDSKQLSGYVIRWSGRYPEKENQGKSFTLAQAMADPTFQMARKIINTLHY